MPPTAHALSASAFFVATAGAFFTHGKSKDMTSINGCLPACLKWNVPPPLRQLAAAATTLRDVDTKQRLAKGKASGRVRKAAYYNAGSVNFTWFRSFCLRFAVKFSISEMWHSRRYCHRYTCSQILYLYVSLCL